MSNSRKQVSPKRKADSKFHAKESTYNYYAAFSHAFVKEIIAELNLNSGDLLVDPWNGRGTTTTVAARSGLRAIGFDLNPAMVSIADAQLVDRHIAKKAVRRAKLITTSKIEKGSGISLTDPLLRWITPRSVTYFRNIQEIFRTIAIDMVATCSASKNFLIAQRRLECFLLLSLSATVREILVPLKTSNPTWIPQQLDAQRRLKPSSTRILKLTKLYLEKSVSELASFPGDTAHSISIQQADSRFIPLPARTVSAVVTSPPYCTRIDYAIATSPELFLLDLVSQSSFRTLRERLLGTTVTQSSVSFQKRATWGAICRKTLARIKAHPSKASGTYYFNNFMGYFSSLHDSMEEIDRVTKAGAKIVLVVQDSYYKDVHVDLAAIIEEFGAKVGWQLEAKDNHVVASTMAASNPSSKNYRSTFSATESVLHFRKRSGI